MVIRCRHQDFDGKVFLDRKVHRNGGSGFLQDLPSRYVAALTMAHWHLCESCLTSSLHGALVGIVCAQTRDKPVQTHAETRATRIRHAAQRTRTDAGPSPGDGDRRGCPRPARTTPGVANAAKPRASLKRNGHRTMSSAGRAESESLRTRNLKLEHRH